MIMNRLNSELRGHAVSYGLCTQWQGDWQNNKSQQELIGMYIRGIDFCIEHDYPTVEYIKGNFDRSLLHQNHIFVDEPVIGGDNGVKLEKKLLRTIANRKMLGKDREFCLSLHPQLSIALQRLSGIIIL